MISLFRLTVAGLTAVWLCARPAAVEVALGETVFTVPDGFTVERVDAQAEGLRRTAERIQLFYIAR